MRRRAKQATEPTRAPSALVIDADAATRRLLHRQLSLHGYQVHLAADAETGLGTFHDQRPDCVLLSTMGPDRDGYDVLRAIRAKPGGRGAVIVLLTASSDRSSWLAWDNGPDMFLAKPFDVHQLMSYLKSRIPASGKALVVAKLEPTTMHVPSIPIGTADLVSSSMPAC